MLDGDYEGLARLLKASKYLYSTGDRANLEQSHVTDPVTTSPFFEYTSGHSVQSAATATVLTDLFDDDHVSVEQIKGWSKEK